MTSEFPDDLGVNLPWANAFAAQPGMVRINVGSAPVTEYLVPRPVLMERCLYAQKALSGPWIEAQTAEISFPDEDPTTFAAVLYYIYTQELRQAVIKHPLLAIRTYVLADRLMMQELQAALMDMIRNAFRCWFVLEFTTKRVLPDDIPRHSGLYRYVVDQIGYIRAVYPDLFSDCYPELVIPDVAAFFAQDTEFIQDVNARAELFEDILETFRFARIFAGPFEVSFWPESYHNIRMDREYYGYDFFNRMLHEFRTRVEEQDRMKRIGS